MLDNFFKLILYLILKILQGEKQHILPDFERTFYACYIASHGLGTSKNTASI